MDGEKKIGKVKEGFFLRQFVGDGITGNGTKFELAVSAANLSPMVLVGTKAFILSWNDICDLAERAGLFTEEQRTVTGNEK